MSGIAWAPNVPSAMADWMRQTGLDQPDMFRLTIGQNVPLAYQQAVQLCAQSSGIKETVIEWHFFELLGTDEDKDDSTTFARYKLAMQSTEELSYIGIKAKKKFLRELSAARGRTPTAPPAGSNRTIKTGLKASFDRPKRPKIGAYRFAGLKPDSAMRDRESSMRNALLKETLGLVTKAGMPHAAHDAANPQKDELRRVTLGLRPRTMSQRLIYLRPLFRYREANWEEPWFLGPEELEAYLNMMAEGECEASTLDSVVLAVKYLEKAGGQEGTWLSNTPAVKNTVTAIQQEMWDN